MNAKLAENKREIKKLTKYTQKTTEENQVADEKTKRNIVLKNANKELKQKIDHQEEITKDLESQLQSDTPPPPPPTIA